ncbi:hypothetical protein B7P43_G15829 [Cryptotermes secundus]|uniref:SEFIR domain-containing protein n=1 Tax=Cryptotermes secundus TaxID=105785 RepID=A0A2J7Q430_9NEOP|nr:hypothetical protein B7P43_G15829 [Cryptotermes secundus]
MLEAALNLKFTIDNESVCIDLYIKNSKHLSPEWSMFYDCSWYNQSIEGRYVLLEYMAKGKEYKEARKFSFITPAAKKLDPCNKSIESHETLTYLDLTSRPHLTLHIQKLPTHFKVHEYEVKQCSCTECNFKQNFEDCVHIETIEAGSEEDDELLVPINIAEESGNFFYIVYANVKIHENRSYYISRTETLTNVNLKGMLTWLSVGLVMLLCFLIIGSLLGTKYGAKLLAEGVHNLRRRRVLLLHDPVHRIHVYVVTCLAQFLEQHCNIDVSLDIRDIPHTENKDPILWYNSEICSVNFVAIISTPPCSDVQEAIYKDLHIVGLNFMKELLRSKTPKTEIFTIILPYCNETGIPALARHLKRIRLMKDFDSMISLIHSDISDTHFSCGQHFCIRKALLRKIHHNLKIQGNDLKSSIAEMENIIKQSGKNGHVLNGPVYKELKSVTEPEERPLTLEKPAIEIRKNGELHDENNIANTNGMNKMEFNLSDIDLNGLEYSAEVAPRNSNCYSQAYEFFCDNLNL